MEQHVIKSIPFYLQVYELVKEKIINGEYRSGERINENRLARELNVSRSPIREALRILEQDELIIQGAKGLEVCQMSIDDIEEVYLCRMAVEPFAARLAAKVITDGQLDLLRMLIDQAKKDHHTGNLDELVKTNTKFHDTILGACGNQRLIAISNKLRTLSIMFRSTEFKRFQRDQVYLDEHTEILEALCSRDGDRVEKVLRAHIANDIAFYKRMSLPGIREK